MRQRFLELALVEQRDAEIAERAGIIGVELDRAAAGGDRLVDAAGEPAHFAEIGVVERDIRLDRDGAAQMLDRLAELARLMRDDAEHVRGLGVVRLGGDGAPGQFVGVGEKAVAALLLGENERVPGADRLRRRRDRGRGASGFRRHDRRRLRGAALAFGLERRQRRRHRRRATALSSLRDARDHGGPVLAFLLAEQPHGRIPGIVLAIEHPAPIGHPRQQHPDRLAERAGEMRDRGIDRDHQIERARRRPRCRRNPRMRAQRSSIASFAALQFLQIGRARAELQARERTPRTANSGATF